jgi:hypothetical protein
MSFTTGLIKTAINLTPKMVIIWVANMVLKGIANVSDFELDLDARKVYVQTTLNGETEAIEVWVEGFAIVNDENSKKFILQQAKSNKLWLNNIFAHITGKAWKIPELPQYKAYIDLVAELLKAERPEQVEEA